MANPIQPWLLLNNFEIAGEKKKIPEEFSILLENQNPNNLSLEQANKAIEQQQQAAILGAIPMNRLSNQDNFGGYPFGIVPFSQTKEGKASLENEKAQEKEALNLQKDGIKSAEERLQSFLGKENQLDLTPLLNLSDMWFGGNLKAGYKAPMTEEQRSRAVQDLQDAVLKAKTGYSANILQGLKNARSARQEEQDAMLKAKAAEAQISALLDGQKLKQNKQEPEKEIAINDKILRSKEAEVIRGTVQMNNAINNYANTIKKHSSDLMTAEAVADIGQAYNDALMAFREANVLGALAQADLETARQKLPDLSSVASFLKRGLGFAPDVDTVANMVLGMKKQYSQRGKQALETLRAGYGKFGGNNLLNKLSSDINSSEIDFSEVNPSREELIRKAKIKMQSQEGSK